MVNGNVYNQYKQNSVMTASPEELTMMLYNGLVKFLMQAKSAIDTKNIEKANNSIIKAQNIISEFKMTLDMNFEVSQNMLSLYDFMYETLVEVNIKKDIKKLENILSLAIDFRDTWSEAMKLSKQMPNISKESVEERMAK